jgi:hypothetical protein
MLWISGTNPAVSLPNLSRIREILHSPELFVVVQDAFPTETAEFADVVLPAALWGEKTGCFTNVDRTVHLSLKAIEPPGEAKSDLDIWLDYARRMDFRDKGGAPLIKWHDPESAFEAWKACSKGRPCDYSGMSYAKLTGGSGIQWPCNEEHPEGAERLYADHHFATDAELCEAFGHDLTTGGTVTPEKYRAWRPAGRAILKPAEFLPPHEQPDEEYPFFLSTGRVVYHFHTRTKTARSQALNDAAPEPFVELAVADAERLGVEDGDMVRLVSRRGTATAPARIGEILEGHLFMPFHYGYWDEEESARPRAANELTIYEWDPVSKQPHYKYAAVRLEKVEAKGIADRAGGVAQTAAGIVGTAAKELLQAMQRPKPPRAHIADYIGLLDLSEQRLAKGFDQVRTTHPDEPDIGPHCSLFADWSRAASANLHRFIEKYGERRHGEPERLDEALLKPRKATAFDLLRDLHDLWLMNGESHVSLVILDQAAQGLRDEALLATLKKIEEKNERQRTWLLTRLKQAAPQTLVVPS